MAGGQQLAVQQGDVGSERTAALTGIAATIAAGSLNVGSDTFDVLSGSEAVFSIGNVGSSRLVPLRSRKVVTGSATVILSGLSITISSGSLANSKSILLSGNSITTGHGSVGKSSARSLTGQQAQLAQTSIGPSGSGFWIAGDINFTFGTAGSQQLTLPSGHVSGGVYEVHSGTLPTGVTLSASGLVSYDGAGAIASASITFAYSEPGALPTITLHPTVTGTLPYMGTWFPLEGVIPSGYSVVSPDDANLRGSILSTWTGGSAKVIVFSGETAVTNGVTKSIRLRVGTTSGANLSAARIDSIVTDIAINFGGGVQTLSNFTSPEKTWWVNPSHICCRYRLAANVGVVEAVIDIHAFRAGVSDRAFVEVTIENCKVNSSSSTVTAPSSASYTNATVSVNGSTIATVSSSAGPNGSHQAFRAWYASTWVGGDPGIEVTHDTASMQAHPMFMKCWKTSDQNLQTLYQNEVYEPWSTEQINVPDMGAGGDSSAIGGLTQWDARYLQSGSKYARRASIASALAALTCNINFRESAGANAGFVPTFTDIGNKRFNGNNLWPDPGASGEPAWEHAHQPAIGLMAFMCRPSPVFMEIAQKIAVWSLVYGSSTGPFLGGNYQVRGKAWSLRAVNHAVFLTPDGNAWKTPAQTTLHDGLLFLEGYKTDVRNKLGFVWHYEPTTPSDLETEAGFQEGNWFNHYLDVELHKGAASKILSGAQHTKYVEIADWACTAPIRFINEATAGEWRSTTRYRTTMGAGGGGADPINTLGDGTYSSWWSNWYSDAPPANSGPWLAIGHTSTLWSAAADATPLNSNGAYYDSYFWAAFCAAVERGLSGADAAWSKVNANITNLSTWSSKFQLEPRWGLYPRNK